MSRSRSERDTSGCRVKNATPRVVAFAEHELQAFPPLRTTSSRREHAPRTSSTSSRPEKPRSNSPWSSSACGSSVQPGS
ncbi:hypothetical protein Taro_051914 [Colocasia esculenta]|uniref:Uncharacterized protein n=1 Tax=Colocasia esculenta TaxID=4460 RepID=A0A843XIG1_COLES|nr:hypothetical protein [Colocasia esculenta]